MRCRVAVIGGGITGLAAAHRLTELVPNVDVLLLESGSRLGGVLESSNDDGFLFESAADSFLTVPTAAIDLCQRLGLDDELIGTDKSRRQALVLKQGRLLPVPMGFHLMAPSRMWPLLSSPILSWRGKLRAGMECLIPGKVDEEDESLQSFISRRFGRELFERLVQPLVGGIYTADPQRLSIEATFPRFRQMEREHGSLILAMLRSRQGEKQSEACGARYGQFAALRSGASTLVNALADRLPQASVQLETPVTGVFPIEDGRWLLTTAGSNPDTAIVDGVIAAVPMHQGARLVKKFDSVLADELQAIHYASCAVVGLGYRREQIADGLNGFGFVVPLAEQRMILSCSYSSIKYAGRAPADSVLLRIFIGGDCQSGLLRLSCDELMELAEREVAELLGIRGAPVLRRIAVHSRSMPQYHVGHRARVERIDDRLQQFPALALAGSSLYGVGVPACIQSGELAATRVVEHLKKHSPNDRTVLPTAVVKEVTP